MKSVKNLCLFTVSKCIMSLINNQNYHLHIVLFSMLQLCFVKIRKVPAFFFFKKGNILLISKNGSTKRCANESAKALLSYHMWLPADSPTMQVLSGIFIWEQVCKNVAREIWKLSFSLYLPLQYCLLERLENNYWAMNLTSPDVSVEEWNILTLLWNIIWRSIFSQINLPNY